MNESQRGGGRVCIRTIRRGAFPNYIGFLLHGGGRLELLGNGQQWVGRV